MRLRRRVGPQITLRTREIGSGSYRAMQFYGRVARTQQNPTAGGASCRAPGASAKAYCGAANPERVRSGLRVWSDRGEGGGATGTRAAFPVSRPAREGARNRPATMPAGEVARNGVAWAYLPSLAMRCASRDTLRRAALRWTTPFWAPRMMAGSASAIAATAAVRSPEAIASSTLRTALRTRERRALLITVRRAICRAAFLADFVLAISVRTSGFGRFGSGCESAGRGKWHADRPCVARYRDAAPSRQRRRQKRWKRAGDGSGHAFCADRVIAGR